MAINEVPGFVKYKDEEGNLNLLLPITTKDHVDGMEEIETALEETVRFTEQILTGEQKAQARTNLGITGTGADGKTPVRGTDYWTDADKAEIKSYVDDAILGGAW